MSENMEGQIDLNLNLSNVQKALQDFERRLKGKSFKIEVQFDKDSAKNIETLAASLERLQAASKGLGTFNTAARGITNLTASIKTLKNVTDADLNMIIQKMTQVNNAFNSLQAGPNAAGTASLFNGIGRGLSAATNLLKADATKVQAQLNQIAQGLNNFNVQNNNFNVQNPEGQTKFLSALKSGMKAFENLNVEKISGNLQKFMTSINQLVGRLQMLKNNGGLAILKELPEDLRNLGIGRGAAGGGGGPRQPRQQNAVRIQRPTTSELMSYRNTFENAFNGSPIKAKVTPEWEPRGLQRFQNLFIALSFGQFEQNLQRLSQQIIGNFSQLQSSRTTLATIYRDRPGRDKEVYDFLLDYEKKTPFSFDEIVRGGTQMAVREKQFQRVGFSVERLMKLSGELASAFDGDIYEIQKGLSRILVGDRNGFEILDKYGISRDVLKQSGVFMGPQGVSLQQPNDIRAVLNAIEKFAYKTTGGNLAEKRSQDLGGVISTMQSQWFKTTASMMDAFEKTFGSLIRVSTTLMEAFEKLPTPIRGFVGAITIAGAGFLKVLQQLSSVSLLVVAADRARLLDPITRGMTGGAAQTAGGMAGLFAAEMAGNIAAGGVMSRLGQGRRAAGRLGEGLLESAPFSQGAPGRPNVFTTTYDEGRFRARGQGYFRGSAPQTGPSRIDQVFNIPRSGYQPGQVQPWEQAFGSPRHPWQGPSVYGPGGTVETTYVRGWKGGAKEFGKDVGTGVASLGLFASLGKILGAAKTFVTNLVKGLATTISELLVTAGTSVAGLLTAGAAGLVGGLIMTIVGALTVKSMNRMDIAETERVRDNLKESATKRWDVFTEGGKQKWAELKKAREEAALSPQEAAKRGITPEQMQRNSQIMRNAISELGLRGYKEDQKTVEELNNELEKSKILTEQLADKDGQLLQVQSARLQTEQAIVEARYKLGKASLQDLRASKQQSVDQASRRLKLNEKLFKMGSISKEEYETTKLQATQEWFEALLGVKQVSDLINQSFREGLQITLEQVKARKKLSVTGQIDLMYADINQINTSTDEGRKQYQRGLAGIQAMETQRWETRKEQRRSIMGLSGNKRGEALAALEEERKAMYDATSRSAQDRERIEQIVALKRKKINQEYYQELWDMAKTNLAKMHDLENQRITMVQEALGRERAMRQAALERLPIDQQFARRKEMDRLDDRAELQMKRKAKNDLKVLKENYEAEQRTLNMELAKIEDIPANRQARASKKREIELSTSNYEANKTKMVNEQSDALKEFQQQRKFRNTDLELANTESMLEAEQRRLEIERERLGLDFVGSGKSYLKILEEQLQLELKALDVEKKRLLANPRLSNQERKNIEADFENRKDQAIRKTQSATYEAEVATQEARVGALDPVIAAKAKSPKAQDQKQALTLLKSQLEMEKQILFTKLKGEILSGADPEQAKKKYLADINKLQQDYLDKAKQITQEEEAQNQAILDRYNNKGTDFEGYSMGEVFGIDQLAENMRTDSEYSRIQYKKLGTKGGYDPFSLDKLQVQEYAKNAELDVYKTPGINGGLGVPSNMKELNKYQFEIMPLEIYIKTDKGTEKYKTDLRPKNADTPNGRKGRQ